MMNQLDKIYSIYRKTGIVSTDSRTVSNGAIYFALKGANFNGNKFIPDVLKKGALLAVSDDERYRGLEKVIVVEDVLIALQQLAALHRRKLGVPIVGITGTNGKTTTKELITAVLKQKYRVSATKGNLNNHIGVPLTILSMDQSVEIGVVEMGANHIGEIAELCAIAQPNCGLITNVGKAHLEGFGSFDGVRKAKGEMYEYLNQHSGMVFINADNTYLQEMGSNLVDRFEYGVNSGQVNGHQVDNSNPFLAIKWQYENQYIDENLQTQLIGGYNVENVLCAIAIGVFYNVSFDKISKAIADYAPSNNRSQYIESAHNKIILDAYNANPTSMLGAISNFNKIEFDKKIVILGGMKELGEDEFVEHEKLMIQVERSDFKSVILVGDEFKVFSSFNGHNYRWYRSYEDLIISLKKAPIKNSMLLIKGSRSNQLEKVVEFL